jgi:hypothetical protein
MEMRHPILIMNSLLLDVLIKLANNVTLREVLASPDATIAFLFSCIKFSRSSQRRQKVTYPTWEGFWVHAGTCPSVAAQLAGSLPHHLSPMGVVRIAGVVVV